MSTESNEFEGKNLDLAVWSASQKLEIAVDKLRYKILEKGRRGRGEDPGEPARIRVLSAEEAEAAASAPSSSAPAREEPRRERPPRRESRPESREPRRESRSRRREEPEEKPADDVVEEDDALPGDVDGNVAEVREAIADDDHGADDGNHHHADAEVEDDAEDDDEDLDEDLDEAPTHSSALLEDDDPIEIAREARRRSAQVRSERVERVDEVEPDVDEDEDDGDQPGDDEPVVEAREPRRERSPRRRSSRSRGRRDDRPERSEPERVEQTDEDNEPAVESREPRRERPSRSRGRRDDRPERSERERREPADEDHEPEVEAREPRRERPSRRREGRRPEGALDPDDLDSGLEKAREIVPQLLEQMGFDLEMDAEIQEDHVYVPLTGEDSEFLLEHRAEGLNALQFLVNKMVYRGGPTRILVDADGYRQERQRELVERAQAVADEVRDGGSSRSLGSLNPFERRLVHMALREDADVRTVSKGEGFLKRMEIMPRHGGGDGGGNESRGRGRRRRERY